MKQQTTSIKSDDLNYIKELTSYPFEAAEVFRKYIKEADLENYKNFLKMMYYYTLDSENKLQYAADKSDNEELRNYFLHMKKEETNHFLLAKKDYEAYGGSIDEDYIPEVVKQFNDAWYAFGDEDVVEFIGALYVFESIANYVRDDIKEMLDRLNATGKQSRWLRVHVEADESHGDEAYEMCIDYNHRNPIALLNAAEIAKNRWVSVFKEALA